MRQWNNEIEWHEAPIASLLRAYGGGFHVAA
jgi:hypothetical protein